MLIFKSACVCYLLIFLNKSAAEFCAPGSPDRCIEAYIDHRFPDLVGWLKNQELYEDTFVFPGPKHTVINNTLFNLSVTFWNMSYVGYWEHAHIYTRGSNTVDGRLFINMHPWNLPYLPLSGQYSINGSVVNNPTESNGSFDVGCMYGENFDRIFYNLTEDGYINIYEFWGTSGLRLCDDTPYFENLLPADHPLYHTLLDEMRIAIQVESYYPFHYQKASPILKEFFHHFLKEESYLDIISGNPLPPTTQSTTTSTTITSQSTTLTSSLPTTTTTTMSSTTSTTSTVTSTTTTNESPGIPSTTVGNVSLTVTLRSNQLLVVQFCILILWQFYFSFSE